MGTFTHPIVLHSVSGDRTEVVEALVDTGATFTAMPAPTLERLGIPLLDRVILRLANGNMDRRAIGEVSVELDGVTRTVICVFGEPDAPATIGAHTLEAFLLGVDPVGRRLIPVEGYWA